ncbi:mitochondrial 54S ribosomal protein YmL44 [Saccharomycopsis crataegensis]|uniref:Large ribosomal subunit protein mL53 n=1 Tax=Saccharomycopsis crataegensis TaxID=43959 RepID=A0AAV5QKK0_9ASCO|nr:mitochondrial 54S ribosomal protein YmL44 [Saccharomycopsis crataegensis]
MITKYFSKVVIKFNPMGKDGKVARVFLSSIPPSMKGSCSIDSQVLLSSSKVEPTIKVTFKDKKTIEADPRNLNVQELGNLFDRHSRQLGLKDSLQA